MTRRRVATYPSAATRADSAPWSGGGGGPSLPPWVPAPGEVAVLTQSNGLLLNTYRSQVASNYSAANFITTVNDYSGSVPNPYWGVYGARVFFGGGHSGTNDNSVTVGEYLSAGINFKRVSVPTNLPSADPDDAVNVYTNSYIDTTYQEYSADGQAASPHTYQMQYLVPPANGGGTYGTLELCALSACGYHGVSPNVNGALAAHRMVFNSMELGTRKWERATSTVGDFVSPTWGIPGYTVYVPPQDRVYILHQGGGLPAPVRWHDRALRTWVTGTGTGLEIDSMQGFDSGRVLYIQSRGLIVAMWPTTSNELAVEWMDVTVSQPTRGGRATLSTTLAVSDPWSMADWCPLNNRILVAGVNSDAGAVHEIEIPTTLTNTWTVTRQAISGGGTIPKGSATSFESHFWYEEKLRAIVYMPKAAASGDDTVRVYRPVGT